MPACITADAQVSAFAGFWAGKIMAARKKIPVRLASNGELSLG